MLCGIGANAAAAALGVVRRQSHSAVLHDYMVKVCRVASHAAELTVSGGRTHLVTHCAGS